MSEIFATHSPCCGITRTGVQEPGVMHSAGCRRKHNGMLGPTLFLVLTPESERELESYKWGQGSDPLIDDMWPATPISLEERDTTTYRGGEA